MQPDRPLFISTSHEMNVTWQACQVAPDSLGRTIALTHLQAAHAAFEGHDEIRCLEECRAAVEALN